MVVYGGRGNTAINPVRSCSIMSYSEIQQAHQLLINESLTTHQSTIARVLSDYTTAIARTKGRKYRRRAKLEKAYKKTMGHLVAARDISLARLEATYGESLYKIDARVFIKLK
jgi:hypothetical protein